MGNLSEQNGGNFSERYRLLSDTGLLPQRMTFRQIVFLACTGAAMDQPIHRVTDPTRLVIRRHDTRLCGGEHER